MKREQSRGLGTIGDMFPTKIPVIKTKGEKTEDILVETFNRVYTDIIGDTVGKFTLDDIKEAAIELNKVITPVQITAKEFTLLSPSPTQKTEDGTDISEDKVQSMRETWPLPISGFNGVLIAFDHFGRLISGHNRQEAAKREIKKGFNPNELIWAVRLNTNNEELIAMARVFANLQHNPAAKFHLMSEQFPFCQQGSLPALKGLKTCTNAVNTWGRGFFRTFSDKFAALMMYHPGAYKNFLAERKIKIGLAEFSNLKNKKPLYRNGWKRMVMKKKEIISADLDANNKPIKMDLNGKEESIGKILAPANMLLSIVVNDINFRAVKPGQKIVKGLKEALVVAALQGKVRSSLKEKVEVGYVTPYHILRIFKYTNSRKIFIELIERYGRKPGEVSDTIMEYLKGEIDPSKVRKG